MQRFSLRRVVTIAALALTGLALVGCGATSPRVRSDFNRSVDFTAFKTFGFPAQTGTDRGGYSTLVTSYFKEAVQREMTARGYTFSANEPDLLVNFYSTTREKTEVYAYPATGVWGFHYGRPRYGFYSAWPFYYPADVDAVQ